VYTNKLLRVGNQPILAWAKYSLHC